jgi:hypothetical protein
MSAAKASNIFAACGAAAFAGVLLNVRLGFKRQWLTLAPPKLLDWFSVGSQFGPGEIMAAMGPTLLCLVGSLWPANPTGASALKVAVLRCIVGLLALAAAFQGSANYLFIDKAVRPEQVPATLHRWLTTHIIWVALATAAAVLGLMPLLNPFSQSLRTSPSRVPNKWTVP